MESGATDETRTRNILLGRQELWPIELLSHIEIFSLNLCINIISRFSRKIKFLFVFSFLFFFLLGSVFFHYLASRTSVGVVAKPTTI